ncbi:mechanosensitive ion channel family protein [Paradesulfitobacterium ferrireducens]|uniref:mechanosensitive ion channel family protein n=1 Tax=Paradesulfitobacterium ferrireducens TaxID=2816476 RepID=UPI001F36E67C|nr:mechanosensitive ion channel family protein [Paradesulfitobacterium ferrireducens]
MNTYLQHLILGKMELLKALGISLLIVAFFWLIRYIVSKYLYRLVFHLTSKSKLEIDDNLALAFKRPVLMFIMFMGIYLALQNLTPVLFPDPVGAASYQRFLSHSLRTFIVIFFAWGLYNMEESSSLIFEKLQNTLQLRIDRILIPFLSKTFRFLTVALAIIVILQEWEYDINGFIAGLGLGGLAFALAAKDTIANIFGGVVIIMDKPFSIGDWIKSSEVEGVVEDINFRSTRIRTFDQALITLPNSILANASIVNWSKMGKRRISFNLGVMYSTPKEKLEACIHSIHKMLEEHPEVHKETILVAFDRFNDSSLDIHLYFFTNTTVWADYMKVKEDINFKIMDILEKNGVSAAFPSQSVYFETPLEQVIK